MEAGIRDTSGSANEIVAMELDQTYANKAKFQLEPTMTV